MEKKELKIRFASKKDTEVLLQIYAPYVKNADTSKSDVSFEYEVPGAIEFAERIENISASFPYIVLEESNVVVGYAYAHPYIPRAAYQWSAEVTIYLAAPAQGKGYGLLLYRVLERLLKEMGVTNLYSCIAGNNEHSIKMHEAMGYKINGTFTQCAFKNEHWLDMVWMEKVLQEHGPKPALVKKIKDVPEAIKAQILKEI